MFKDKFIYLVVLLGVSFLLYKGVEMLAFKGILDEFESICMLLSLIASHLISVKLLRGVDWFSNN